MWGGGDVREAHRHTRPDKTFDMNQKKQSEEQNWTWQPSVSCCNPMIFCGWRAVTGIKLLETYLYPLSYLRIHLLKSLLLFSSRWMFESWSLKLNGSVKWDSNWCLIWNRPPLKSKVGYWAWFRVLYTTYVRNKDSTKIALRNGKWLRSHSTNSLRLSTSDNNIMFPRPCWPPTPGQPTWSPTVTPWSVWPWTESKSRQENNNQSWEQNIQSILIIFIFSSSVVSLWLHQRVIKIHLSCF